MRRGLLFLLVAAWLTGCASLSGAPLLQRSSLQAFAMEGRFALRLTPEGQPPRSVGGRIDWTHTASGDRILMANPLGIGVAEIEVSPNIARLRTADGQQQESGNADELIATVTGEALPIGRLPLWLSAQWTTEARAERDGQGRPVRVSDTGWVIEYSYPDDTADALPDRLTLRRDESIELKLRIERWREAP